MHRRRRLRHRSATALACLALGWAAVASAVSPQWIVNVENREYTQEKPAENLAASWTSMADGSQLLVSLDRSSNPNVLLRRIDPQGQVALFSNLDMPSFSGTRRALLAASQTGAFALTSSTSDQTRSILQFFEADGRRRWSVELPGYATYGDGPAVALSAQPDGSVLALRKHSVMKVDANGQVRWHFSYGSNDHLMLDQADMVVDSYGVTWVGGRGGLRLGADHLTYAAVRRLDSRGNLLSLGLLLCDSCSQSRVLGLAALPNGEVAAVGRSGANEPGFFAVYANYGAQRLRTFTAPGGGYDRVVADAANNVYALSRDTRTVSAIDIANGNVRWQRPGSDITALPDGVLITEAPASGTGELAVSAFDANGNAVWTRQLEASDGSAAGGARLENGVIRLVSMVERISPDCGLSPSLVTLDANGTLLSERRACTVPRTRYWHNASSDSDAGAVGNLGQRMLRFSALGEKVWEYSECALCTPSQTFTYTTASLLLPDATTWITTRRTSIAPPATDYALLHLAADGSVLSQTALPQPGTDPRPNQTSLLADANQVVVLVPYLGGLSLSRVSTAGTLLGSASFALPGAHDGVTRSEGRLWPDGSISLVSAREYDAIYCDISPPQPQCGPPSNTVLRINADGSERWRVDLERAWLTASIGDDASHVVLISAPDSGESVRLQRIDASGTLSAAVTIADSVDGLVGPVIGPVRGRYLFSAGGGYRLVDGNGTLLAAVNGDDGFSKAVAYAQHGFLVSSDFVDGRLVSADDLSVLAVFDVDTPDLLPRFNTDHEYWSLFDDGSVYMTQLPARVNGFRPRLARFAVPGSPADDLIFIDRF